MEEVSTTQELRKEEAFYIRPMEIWRKNGYNYFMAMPGTPIYILITRVEKEQNVITRIGCLIYIDQEDQDSQAYQYSMTRMMMEQYFVPMPEPSTKIKQYFEY